MDLVDLTKSKMTEGRLKKSDQKNQCKNLMLGTNTNRIQFCGVFCMMKFANALNFAMVFCILYFIYASVE